MDIQNPQDIVSKWNQYLNRWPTEGEKAVLRVMYERAQRVGDVAISVQLLKQEAMAQLSLSGAGLEQILDNLGTDRERGKNCIELRDGTYRLRAAGWEAFEPRRDVLQRLTLLLADIHAEKRYEWIQTSLIAREMRFGDYRITKFYLEQLRSCGVVTEDLQTLRGTASKTYNTNVYKLTRLGTELAEYLRQQTAGWPRSNM